MPRSLQDNQLAYHMIAAKVLRNVSSRQQTEHPGEDARLLAVACSQLDPMLSTDLKLFGSSSALQTVYEQAHRYEQL